MRSFIFILLAALFLGSAAYLGNKYLFDTEAEQAFLPFPAEKTVDIYALRLTRAVTAGEIFEKSMVEWEKLPEDDDTALFLTKATTDLAEWQGAVFTHALSKDAFVEETQLIRPTEAGYRTALMGEEMRARPVKIENLKDFEDLRPGNYVDLVLTYVPPPGAAGAGETVVKTLLENIRVISLKPELDINGKRPKTESQSVNLALTPEAVELVSVAEAVGDLRISLHGSGRKLPGPASEKVAVSASDFFPSLKPAAEKIILDQPRVVRIMRGSETSVLTLSEEGNPASSSRKR